MLKILALLLSLLALSACGSCNTENLIYSSFGGNESITSLELLPNNMFNLKHESWKPGQKDKSTKSNSQGQWSCNKNNIQLNIENKHHSSSLVVIGKNPLGLDEKEVALHFQEGDIDFLSNEILYPSYLED
ncbi:MAG: hypothetical protein JKY01_14020 [Pseudomonadales bacterium]|nr:hypothetical protein [Pseudomonadales bacterium]